MRCCGELCCVTLRHTHTHTQCHTNAVLYRLYHSYAKHNRLHIKLIYMFWVFHDLWALCHIHEQLLTHHAYNVFTANICPVFLSSSFSLVKTTLPFRFHSSPTMFHSTADRSLFWWWFRPWCIVDLCECMWSLHVNGFYVINYGEKYLYKISQPPSTLRYRSVCQIVYTHWTNLREQITGIGCAHNLLDWNQNFAWWWPILKVPIWLRKPGISRNFDTIPGF